MRLAVCASLDPPKPQPNLLVFYAILTHRHNVADSTARAAIKSFFFYSEETFELSYSKSKFSSFAIKGEVRIQLACIDLDTD